MKTLSEVVHRILNPAHTSGRVCPECGMWRANRYFQSTTVPNLPQTKQRHSWLNWMTAGVGEFPPESEIPCRICGSQDITLVGSWEQNANHQANIRATLLQRWYGASISFKPGDPDEEAAYLAWIRATFSDDNAKASDFDWTRKPWLD